MKHIYVTYERLVVSTFQIRVHKVTVTCDILVQTCEHNRKQELPVFYV